MCEVIVDMLEGEIVVYHLMDDDIAQLIFLPVVVARYLQKLSLHPPSADDFTAGELAAEAV